MDEDERQGVERGESDASERPTASSAETPEDRAPGVQVPRPLDSMYAPPPPAGSVDVIPSAPPGKGGLRRAWAILGVVTGFLFSIVPGLFALRSYRRWRRGQINAPTFAWVWAWIAVPLIALGIAGGVVLTALLPNQLLSANFDHGPGPFSVATTPCCAFDVVNGTYRIRVLHDIQGGAPRSFASLVREAGDVAVSVEIVQVVAAGPNDLVAVGCGGGNGQGYLFAAGIKRGFAILKQAGNQATPLRTDETAPIPGSGGIKSLRFSCDGTPFSGTTELRASINGKTVATVKDPHGLDSFTEIVLAFSGEAGTEVRFDNVLARVG